MKILAFLALFFLQTYLAIAQTTMLSFAELEKYQLLQARDQIVYEQWSKSDGIKALQKKPTVFELLKPLQILRFASQRISQQENEESQDYDTEEVSKIKPNTNKKKNKNDIPAFLHNLLKIKLIDKSIHQTLLSKMKKDESLNYKSTLVEEAINLHIQAKRNQKILQNYFSEFLLSQQLIDSQGFKQLTDKIAQNNSLKSEDYYEAMNPIIYATTLIDSGAVDATCRVFAQKIPNLDISKLHFKLQKKLIQSPYNSDVYSEQTVITHYQGLSTETVIYNQSDFTFNDAMFVLNDFLAHQASPYRFIQAYTAYEASNPNTESISYSFLLKEASLRNFNEAGYNFQILSPFYFSDEDFQNYLKPAEIRQKLEDCRSAGLFNHLNLTEVQHLTNEAVKKDTKSFASILSDFPGALFNLEKAKPYEIVLKKLAAQEKYQLTDIIDESRVDSSGALDYSQPFLVSFKLNGKVYKLDHTEVYDYYAAFMDLLEVSFEENNLEIRFYEIVDMNGGMVILLSSEQASRLRQKNIFKLRLM